MSISPFNFHLRAHCQPYDVRIAVVHLIFTRSYELIKQIYAHERASERESILSEI